ncbi:PTS sugar transporter subunit IIA [Altererythrobacter sp. CAU 1778]
MSLYKLEPSAIACQKAGGKGEILVSLAALFEAAYGLDRGEVLERLEERESLGSTGFGRGVAIPHARLEGLGRPVAALIRLNDPVEFDAADGMPVELVFGLVSPENAGATHLHALAAISRLVRDEEMQDALLRCDSPEAIYAMLNNATEQSAA